MVEGSGTMPEFDAFGFIAPGSMPLASAHGVDKNQSGVRKKSYGRSEAAKTAA